MNSAVLMNDIVSPELPNNDLIQQGEVAKAKALAGAVSTLLGSVTHTANRDIVMGISYSSSMED